MNTDDREKLLKILAAIRQAAKDREANKDKLLPELRERIIVEKFDKEFVNMPGVEGLAPIETIVIEDGEIIERRCRRL